ncbi:hypothetical protein FRC19_004560 [Serendipita sp. 401]|nr:hypothetical protein FRC19_004560 [Serendipita sp. 401]
MPVTFKVASHDARKFQMYGTRPDTSPEALVQSIWSDNDGYCQEVLQSSYRHDPAFSPRRNGFIDAVVEAYNNHHHLIIRPDDVWCAILSQFNLYVNANAEELRSKFVAHEGQKELEVKAEGTRYTVDFGMMAATMGQLLKQNILDPSLHVWIIPDFTTTTPNDVVICSIMMMSTLQKYFTYLFTLDCGIPTITLLGEKKDYLSILHRLDKFEEFGQEPILFANFLRPILKEFVNAFDYNSDKNLPNLGFWEKICHEKGGSGPEYLSGWITAFSVWNMDGKWQGGTIERITEPEETSGQNQWPRPLYLANMRYPVVNMDDVPRGFCQVPVKLDDNGEMFNCTMIAGHVGMDVSNSATGIRDTLRPSMQWFMFIKRGHNEPRLPLPPRPKEEQGQGPKPQVQHGVDGRRNSFLSKLFAPLKRNQSVKGKEKS